MANKSDYRDPRTNLFELLPEVFRSQTNEAVFEDVFNRYLSNPQLEQVDGYVGEPLPEGSIDRQIVEPTACRQAFQLQPLLFAKLGTVNHLASYEDILNELGRTGVSDCRLPLWGNALQFNWIPPIDLDKIVNFRDYYWYCPADPSAPPQYITIESPCQEATQKVDGYQLTLDTYGDEFDIVGLNTTDPSITIDGDITEVFTEGFVFFVKNSTNASIDVTFFTTVSSSYDGTADQTTIVVEEAIGSATPVNGVVSIFELMLVFVSEKNCACSMDVGWDMALWDDNQIGDILWTAGSPNLLTQITHATEAAWCAANPAVFEGSPAVLVGGCDSSGSPIIPATLEIWFDTTTNTLKQFDGTDFVIVQNNFSVIVAQVQGTHMWDYTTTCDNPSNPWSDQNKWFHKNHVPNFTIARRAEIPIIEYDFDVQLNTWTFTDFLWQYRESEFFDFETELDIDGNRLSPDLNELLPFIYSAASGTGKITLSPAHGDRTAEFPPGHVFRIVNESGSPSNNGVYTVSSVVYATTATTPNDELATIITVVESLSIDAQSLDTLLTVPGSPQLGSPFTAVAGSPLVSFTAGTGGQITPNRTSINNDPFRGYNEHWLLVDEGETLAVPSPVQTANPFTEINPLSVPTQVGSPIFAEYIISDVIDLRQFYGTNKYLYAIQYTVTLLGGVPANTVFPLDLKMSPRVPPGPGSPALILVGPPVTGAKLGDNSIRVFVDDVQQYGTYIERDDITPSEFIDGIEFISAVDEFVTIRILQSEAATVDIGRALVPVRTIRDNVEFIQASSGSPPGVPIPGTGSPADLLVEPQTLNLIQYRFAEQEKILTNQYPLFDMFDCHGDPLFEATPLFTFKEDQDAPINVNVQKRIVIGENDDFAFTQFLIDTTDEDTEHPIIFSYQLAGNQQTIWRKGLNDEEYVPEFVDANRDPITVGDPDGCWEVSDQLFFNTEHENRECVTFSEILTHFRSILAEQNNVPGFIVPGNQAYLLTDDFNFGLGGHIKEFNDSYDTFLSSVFVDNVTPLGVVDFAHDQYENSLNTIKELYISNVLSFLTSTSSASINSLQDTITTFVINQYELNDFHALVYGDSNTFRQGSPEIGVKNWPATLPFVRLGFKHPPYIIEDETTQNDDGTVGVLQLVHHDGHRSNPSLTATQTESIIQITLNTIFEGENLGIEVSTAFGSPIQPTTPPDDFSVLRSVITPRRGIYWYDTGDPDRVLYRFNVSAVDDSPPGGVPIGAYWYDTDISGSNPDGDFGTLRQLNSSSLWEAVESVGSPDVNNGIITSAWVVIDTSELLINTLLEVEDRLFEAACGSPTLTELSFDVDDVRSTEISCPTASTSVTEDDTTEGYFEEAYLNFLIDQGISDPFSADQFFDLSDPFTWNYTFSKHVATTDHPVAGAVFQSGSPSTPPNGGWWLDLYKNVYGTSYPHLEPWYLQGYEDKPSWWDAEYLNDDPTIYGNRRWKYIHRGTGSPIVSAVPVGSPTVAGSPIPPSTVAARKGMWENIRVGFVPVGELLPDGVTVSDGTAATKIAWRWTGAGSPSFTATWKYFSVNIDDIAVDGFEPDEVFPPFWDVSNFPYLATASGNNVRSIFSTFFTEIVLPSADYTFETGAPSFVEWEESSQRLYDNLTVGYRMQPIRFMHDTFGVEFIEVAGKQINTDTCRVYSHKDVEFHGDIVNTNEVLIFEGLNQWYVNFNRFSGFDVSASDFRPLWRDWDPLLTYQFGSIIDTQTFQINNRNFDITERDYQIVLKRSPGIEDHFLDAFAVTVLEAQNELAGIDTQSSWKFEVDTFFPTTRTISYYQVHNYPVSVDTVTNEFTVYQFEIVDVDATAGTFTLLGDQRDAFTDSLDFVVSRSTAGSPISSNDGSFTATQIAFDTTTNRTTVFTGTTLSSGTAAGVLTTSYRTHPWETGDRVELTSTILVPSPLRANLAYFIIKIDDVTFQLAATAADAQTATPINIASTGSGVTHTGQVFSKFTALNGAATSREWNHYVIDTRFTRSLVPPARLTGVQTIIDFIDGYAVITSEEGWDVNFESFELDPDSGDPITWQLETERFIDQIYRIPRTGLSVPDFYGVTVNPITNVFTFGAQAAAWTTGTKIQFSPIAPLPTPLIANQNYYVIRDSATDFRIALTASAAILESELDIISGAGTEFSAFIPQTPSNRHPAVEINPFRNNVWINSPQGVLSNVIEGPSMDIRNVQLVTDQNGKQLTNEDISVFRWDKISRIYIPKPIRNPSVPLVQTTEYNTLHMAGTHLFFDGYECVILFNDRSIENILVYDPFVGLNTARFFMQFFRQDEFTQRPTVGGYFLTPDDQILRNLEASTKDLENIYDTFDVLETTPLIKEGRRSLGYGGPGSLSYLDEIGLNPKSQFLFWRGMIQNKGSVNAIDAFTNNIIFEDAVVDEYWAYKVAEFGSDYEQEYPALNLFVEDSQQSEKRFEFLTPGQPVGAADQTFEGVLTSNQDRWHNQPDVLVDLADNNLSMYFDAEITSVQSFTTGTPEAGSPVSLYFVEADVPFDSIVLLIVNAVTNSLVVQLTEDVDYSIVNSRLVSFVGDPATGLTGGSPEGQLEYRLYTINPAKQKINPTKVIDFVDDIVVEEVPVWDPGRGHQYHIGNNLVNFENVSDSASYTDALDLRQIDSEFWNAPEVDRIWWDTAERGYLPYYDHNIFGLDDRIQNWGKLADWSTVKLYQWTESNILPTEWNDVAAQEELNFSIDPQIRKSGTVRLETSQRTRTPFDIVDVFPSTYPVLGSPEVDLANCITVSDVDDQLLIDDRIVFITDDELPLPLESGTFYFITAIVEGGAGSPAVRNIRVSLEEGGDILEITPGPLFIDVSGNSLDTGSPAGTGLVNDFDTAGLQDVSFSAPKGLSSGTGLTLGTAGFQEVDFSIGIIGSTPTGLDVGAGGSQVITFTGGSPWTCGLATGLTVGVFYGITISVDGATPQAIYVNGTAAGSYASMASQISGQLTGGTASCDSGIGITVTSNSSGPGSTVDVVDGAAFVAPLLGSTTHFLSISAATPGTEPTTYETTIAVNSGSAQTIEVTGAELFSTLVTQMNNQLTGAVTSITGGGELRVTSSTSGIASSIDIADVDLFSSMVVGGGSPVSGTILTAIAGTGVTYFQNFAVNGGGTQSISVIGDDAQTFAQLINVLDASITGASVSLTTSDEIRIVSDSTGIGSSIDIIPGGSPPIFASMSDFSALEVPIDGVDATSYEALIDLGNGNRLVNIIGNQAQTFADLIDEINSQITSGFIASTPSGDLQITAGNNTVTVTDVPGTGSPGTPLFASLTGFVSPFIPLNTGEGSHQIVPPFRDDAWVQLETIRKELIDARDKNNASEFDLAVAGSPSVNGITDGDVVDVYKNGFLNAEDVTVGTSGLTVILDTLSQDFVTALKPKHVLTDEESAFDPDVSDDGTLLIQYKEDTNFSTTFKVNELGVQVPVYYFWVENKSTRQGKNVSMRNAVSTLEVTPTPYTIFDKLTDETLAGSPLVIIAPKRYTQLIVRGLAGIVDDTDRYELRFTRDFTLRDDLIKRNYPTDLPADFSRVDQEPLDLKTLYTEWTLIREKQPFNIVRPLWNKITEAIIGREIDNPAARIPSLARELYDTTYDTQTQYGLRNQQAFVNGALALATVIDDLEDPDNDFLPVDIGGFFATHTFDTEVGIIDAMDDIYNTFPTESVNRIWFKVLFDAFTTKEKYPDIFKTSWISLSGTQIFQTEDLFSG